MFQDDDVDVKTRQDADKADADKAARVPTIPKQKKQTSTLLGMANNTCKWDGFVTVTRELVMKRLTGVSKIPATSLVSHTR